MKRLGKLLLLAILSVSMLNASEVSKVFSLKDNNYGDVTSTKTNKYQINKNLILSLKLDKTDELDGYMYRYNSKSGYNGGLLELNIFNKKIKNWVFTENIFLNRDDSDAKRFLTFVDNTGIELPIYFTYKITKVSDKSLNTNSSDDNIKLKVLYVNNTLSVYYNDNKIYSNKKRFSNLKYIRQNFYYEGSGDKDILIDLTLSEIK